MIVTSIFGILTLPCLVVLIYLYVTQSSRPVPWLHIGIVYFLGYIYCGMVSVATNLTFSAACSTINLRILNFKRMFRGWSKSLTEALNEYQGLYDFMCREVEDIKWWLLVNFISFIVTWLVDLHLWQILASGEGDVVRLVFYKCSWSEPLSAPKLHLPDRVITACEIFFSGRLEKPETGIRNRNGNGNRNRNRNRKQQRNRIIIIIIYIYIAQTSI